VFLQGHLWGDVLEHQIENPAAGKQHDAAQNQGAVHQHQKTEGGAGRAEQGQGGERQDDLARRESVALAVADFPVGVKAFRQVLHADQECQQVSLAATHRQCCPQGEGVHQSGDTENALNKYLAKVRDTIDYNKQYPHRARMRRQEGTVKVSFWINAAGRAEKVAVVESSGSRILDRATQELVSRLRFDAPPKNLDSIPVEILAPVDYDLSNS